MEDIAKDKKTLYISVILFVLLFVLLVIISIFGYLRGYRLQENLIPGKVGMLTLNLPLVQTNVFIDQQKETQTLKDNQILDFPLSPRRHSIIISHDGYYPWTKEILMTSGGNIKLSPIFVTVNTTGQIITDKDPEYLKLKRGILENILPAKDSPKVSTDRSALLWMDDNAILVRVASTTYKVIQPDTIIRSVDFYKNRRDVVIFSSSNSIYVIEVNKEGKQNFMPIYKGRSPSFIKTDQNFIYVLDGNNLMEVII